VKSVSKKKMAFDLYDARFEKYATNQYRPGNLYQTHLIMKSVIARQGMTVL